MNPYWRRKEREALLRRLEMAVEAGVIPTSTDALETWNREVPAWWKWDGLASTRLFGAWDRRFLRKIDSVLGDTR